MVSFQGMNEVRIDKWLWAVRLFKTRALAAKACQSKEVMIAGAPVKPSRNVRVGDTITAQVGDLKRTVKVLGLLSKRVGAAAAPEFAEDLTPPQEYAKQAESRARTHRAGPRPGKHERKALRDFLEQPVSDEPPAEFSN